MVLRASMWHAVQPHATVQHAVVAAGVACSRNMPACVRAQPACAPARTQVTGCDADLAEEKRRQLPFKEVEALAFSFKRLARITSLGGFERLTRLRLDNNRLTKIENIAHLVRVCTHRTCGYAHAAASNARYMRGLASRPVRNTPVPGQPDLAGPELQRDCSHRGPRDADQAAGPEPLQQPHQRPSQPGHAD